ncbi:MAG: nuclear transport factor 2 family protein [Myxococcota bacterium]|nr:nuclear transport factor 2 family protein [Myxococcota bacterium]
MRAKVIVQIVVMASLLVGGPALAKPDTCPKPDKKATPDQVFAARLLAMQQGDIEAIACSYDQDAVVVFPGSVIRGREAIMQAFLAFAGALGGTPPTITSTTEADDTLLVTYEVITPTLSIPDGADAFVIRDGRIQYQLVHGTIVFNQP